MAQWLSDENWLQRDAAERSRILTDLLQEEQLPRLPRQLSEAVELKQTVEVFRAIASARRRFGEDAVGLFIISMTQGADDVLTALALNRVANGTGLDNAVLDIAPLLETVDDLHSGPAIISALLQQELYRKHVQARGGRQVVMIGYSDSNKDSGIVASRWALQDAQKKLLGAGSELGVEIVFFHGRGGTVSRGGGNLVNGILGAPEGSINGYMRLTEQGEVINQKYGVRPIALRNLELITGATLSHSLTSSGQKADARAPDKDHLEAAAKILTCMARVSREKYRSLVYENDRFPAFFRAITPIDVIERLTISSRPASRRSGEGIGIGNLRAIPWVFSWAQTRIGFPGVFGMGAALQKAVADFGIEALRSMLVDWPFFQALVKDVEMVLAKSELDIGRRYAELAPPGCSDLFQTIEDEFTLVTHWILELNQSERLLDDDRTLQRNIRLRNPYIDPLHMLQIDLLQRWREGERKDEALLKALMSTVNGISLGIQNTG
jgi:phosphoenolpyruvate carboxylase